MRSMALVVFLLLFTIQGARSGTLFELGVKAGANVTHPRGLADGINYTEDLTLQVGAFTQVGLGDLLSIGAEIIYEGRRFTLRTSLPGGADSLTSIDASTVNIPLFLRIGLPLGFSAELGAQYSQFVGNNDDVLTTAQGLALLGLAWHPLDPVRIGVRFQPSFSALDVSSAEDIGLNVTSFYVAWIIL